MPKIINFPSKKGLLYLVENSEENRLYFGNNGQLNPDSPYAQYVFLKDLRKLDDRKSGYVVIDMLSRAKRTWTGRLKIRRGTSRVTGIEYTFSKADSRTIEKYL